MGAREREKRDLKQSLSLQEQINYFKSKGDVYRLLTALDWPTLSKSAWDNISVFLSPRFSTLRSSKGKYALCALFMFAFLTPYSSSCANSEMLTESSSTDQTGLSREQRSGLSQTLGVWDSKKQGTVLREEHKQVIIKMGVCTRVTEERRWWHHLIEEGSESRAWGSRARSVNMSVSLWKCAGWRVVRRGSITNNLHKGVKR